MGLQHWLHGLHTSPIALAPAVWDVEQTEFDRDAFPLGCICEWSYQDLTALQASIATLNAAGKRAAIIDTAKRLNTAAWRLLTQAGVNWLVRPDTLTAALANVQLLLASGEFSLIVVDGFSSDQLLPAQVERLQRLVPAQATLVFATPLGDTLA
ncbi:MAG: hypothetical protein HC926_05275 [Synechococcaceae cyanobacterium SM2_3_60]|nr:hypothetical protein [Synechococcaceae cyanobacterium SM2_3_60]